MIGEPNKQLEGSRRNEYLGAQEVVTNTEHSAALGAAALDQNQRKSMGKPHLYYSNKGQTTTGDRFF